MHLAVAALWHQITHGILLECTSSDLPLCESLFIRAELGQKGSQGKFHTLHCDSDINNTVEPDSINAN